MILRDGGPRPVAAAAGGVCVGVGPAARSAGGGGARLAALAGGRLQAGAETPGAGRRW